MTTVFIGGSRAVSRLNPTIRDRLDDLMRKGCRIVIGDANGADKAVQQYLAAQGYRNVTIYCMEKPRNNIGNWKVRSIQGHSSRRGFAYYATKDIAMANEADCGVMLWDGRSKGTLHNILNLVRAGKKVLVYFSPERKFYKISGADDLETLLARCDRRNIERIQRDLAALAAPLQEQLPFR